MMCDFHCEKIRKKKVYVKTEEKNVKVKKKIFIKENALDMDWKRDSWLNPPYENVKLWIQKAYDEHRKWNVSILALLFVKSDTRVWHECILHGKSEILFLEGRVHFWQNGKRSKNPAPYPSAFVFWRAT